MAPDFQPGKSLVPFATTNLEFRPTTSNSFGFACGMNMLHGTLVVEQNGTGSEGTNEPPEGHEAHMTFVEVMGVGPRLEVGEMSRGVSNQQKWGTLRPERSGVEWEPAKLSEGPVVASLPFDRLSLHLLERMNAIINMYKEFTSIDRQEHAKTGTKWLK